MKLLVLNGPNLNLLGTRDPEHYGSLTLADIETQLTQAFDTLDLVFMQDNHEGELVDALHMANRDEFKGVVFNAGAYTHTSVALRDAVAAIKPPVVEVHLSNVHGREEFRRHSYLAPVCAGQISGFGAHSYHLALQWFMLNG